MLSLSCDGVRITESIPPDQLAKVQTMVDRGRILQEALRELAAINGILFQMTRKQAREKTKTPVRKKKAPTR